MNKDLRMELQNFYAEELEAGIGYIMCGCLANEDLTNLAGEYVEIFSVETKCEVLEQYFADIYTAIQVAIKDFQQEQDFVKKFDDKMYARGLFSLLEGTVEDSKLTQNVMNQLRIEYGENYIEKIAEFDRQYLSQDGLKYFEKTECTDFSGLSNAVKSYLLLKRYQDITHKLCLELIDDIFKKFVDSLVGDKEFKNSFVKEQYVKNLYIDSKLKGKPHTLDDVAKFVAFGFSQNVKDVLGGKAYGLGVLQSLNQDVPSAICCPVDFDFNALDLSLFDENKLYSVRSSANIEDGENNSFAGMFDSFLGIKKAEIVSYCNKVLDSVNNQRVKDYINKFNLDNPHMAVIVQEYREPRFSGIWMGTNEHTGILEYTIGSGDKIVSGQVVPNQEIWAENTQNDSYLSTAGEFVGKTLLKLQGEIYQRFNVLPDFEWCIIDDKIKLLQFRSVTSQIQLNNSENESVSGNIVGVPCSAGVYEAVAQFVGSPANLDSLQAGNILLSVFTDPDWICGLDKAGAIVTAMGGFLCHAAITARELKIPCVTGIGFENLKLIKDKKIKINGNTGEIIIVEND